MNVLVALKRVVDAEVSVRPTADGSAVDTANVRMAMNPFDEVALEEAVRWKEHALATEVVVVSCGPSACQDTLRTALAFGADRAVLVQADADLQPLAVAKLLKAVAEREGSGIIVCGKQAIDDDSGQTGQMLAALLGWSQAVAAAKVELGGDGALVTQEIDGGAEVLQLPLPFVLTVDLHLNHPRYPSLPNVLKAKKRPVEVLLPADLGVDVAPRLATVRIAEAPRRRGGGRVADVSELLSKLRDEARVIP
ncbi:MAG: electron transfer flavoprotein subunit beta/FixA family protein [Dehalococcoidia bacterium]|nr:electron transfer flavoprotein subunit beta/FixA family protein [Dehalococcoidia bacterium]